MLKGLLIFTLLFNGLPALAMASNDQSPNKFGLVTGYADQQFLTVSYHFENWFFKGQYNHRLWDSGKWEVDKVFQPQFNLTRYRPVDEIPEIEKGYEFGLNPGFMVEYNIHDPLSAYFLFTSGPHFISGTPERQIDGFIFSNNLAIGKITQLSNTWHLDLRAGFRHVSNASTRSPNGGINSVSWLGGLLYDF